ncbi:ADP-ribosylation factor-like 13A, partial [Cuculus canorus]
MFHLFSHCWSWLQAIQEPIRKVTLLVVGLDNAGKTSVIMDIERAGEVLPAVQPGQTRLRVDRFEVTLVDLPGGQRSRSTWRSHYSAAHGLLFVLDSSDLARMEEVRKVLSRVLSHPDVSGKPLLLLANKQDATAALLPCELIERLCLERLVNENCSPCRIEPCAARRDHPIGPARTTLQGLRWLLRAIPATPLPPPSARAARARPPTRRGGRGSPHPQVGTHCRPGRILEMEQRRRGSTGPSATSSLWGAPTPSPHPLYPAQEETTKGPGRRKRKVKVRKKSSGQPSPVEEPEGPGGVGDSRAGAAGGLLPPNRVGQEEPILTVMATPHPGKSWCYWHYWHQDPQIHPIGWFGTQQVQGMKKKKKKKIKNKIKSQDPAMEQQREEVSSTFDLYRRAMLALKMRQEQRKQ